MFVMVNASDNPWVVALLVLVQVVIPLLQSNAGSDGSYALSIAALFVLGLSALTLWKVYRFCHVLYLLRGRVRSPFPRDRLRRCKVGAN
jgi:hypothetical protein